MFKYILLLIPFFFQACTTHVTLTVKNGTKYPLSTKIDNSTESETISNIGLIKPDESKVVEFDIPNNDSYQAVGSHLIFADYAKSSEETPTTDPFTSNALLQPSKSETNPENDLKTLSGLFSDRGEYVGFMPESKESLHTEIFGSLTILYPADGNGLKRKPSRIVPGGSFYGKIKEADIDVPTLSFDKELKIQGSAGFKANIPLISANFENSSNAYYHTKFSLSRFGWTTLPKPSDGNTFDYQRSFENLSHRLVANIVYTLAHNPGSSLIFVDSAYVVNNCEAKIIKGVETSTTGDTDYPGLVTTNAYFKFKTENIDNIQCENMVINISGNPIYPEIMIAEEKTNDVNRINPVGLQSFINNSNKENIEYTDSEISNLANFSEDQIYKSLTSNYLKVNFDK